MSMSDNTKEDLLNYVVRLGDDALILGHRLSEWTSNGPFLEEDIVNHLVSLNNRERFETAVDFQTVLDSQNIEMLFNKLIGTKRVNMVRSKIASESQVITSYAIAA